jgi:plasmid maintenance system antidote protein VapI
MKARDISVTQLAALSGLSEDVIAGVLDGAVVDAAIAQGLSQGLGSSTGFWLRLQGGYEAQQQNDPGFL